MQYSHNGQSIESNLSLEEARARLTALRALPETPARTKEFLWSMIQASMRNPSAAQKFWIHKLANEGNKPKETVSVGNFQNLAELFKTAQKNGLKRPAITFQSDSIGEIRLYLAGPQSTNPGCIYLRVSDNYMGKISEEGNFSPVPACTEAVKEFLKNFNQNVLDFATTYGKESGFCCFCNIELKDERSIFLGRGPICSRKFGLPVPY